MSKILVIEDESAIRRVLVKILSEENTNYQLEEAEDGLIGIEMIKKEDFDPFPIALSRLPKRVKDLFPCRMRKDEQPEFLVPPLNCDNIHLSRHFVRESDAVSVATMTQIKEELRAGIFQAIPFWQKWMRLNYGFIYLRGRTLAPAVVAYMDETRELERKLTEEGKVLWEQFVPKRIATATAAYR